LVIGALTLDIIRTPKAEERRVGGGAYYCSVTAARLGAEVELRTIVGADAPREHLAQIRSEGVNVVAQETPDSVKFVNTLTGDGRRVQQVASTGGPPIELDAGALKGFDMVQITPVLAEVDPSLLSLDFPRATAIETQGFVREKKIGPLSMRSWSERDLWTRGKLLVHISDEELPYFCKRGLGEALTENGPGLLALTSSAKGSFVVSRNMSLFVPSIPIDVVDDVGCGDVYSVTMLASLFMGRSPLDSAIAATAAATLTAEGRGLENLRFGKEFKRREREISEAFREFGFEGHLGRRPVGVHEPAR